METAPILHLYFDITPTSYIMQKHTLKGPRWSNTTLWRCYDSPSIRCFFKPTIKVKRLYIMALMKGLHRKTAIADLFFWAKESSRLALMIHDGVVVKYSKTCVKFFSLSRDFATLFLNTEVVQVLSSL